MDAGNVVGGVALLAAAVVFVALWWRGLALGPRGRGEVGDRWLAVVTCSGCGHEYEGEWTSGVSFRSLRMGLERYQKCRSCGRLTWAKFDRWATPTAAPPE